MLPGPDEATVSRERPAEIRAYLGSIGVANSETLIIPVAAREGENLKIVANLDTGSGTDMEFAPIGGREYAFVASRSVNNDGKGGLNVIDVTKPEILVYQPTPGGKLRLVYECAPLAFVVEQAGGVLAAEAGVAVLRPCRVAAGLARRPVEAGDREEGQAVDVDDPCQCRVEQRVLDEHARFRKDPRVVGEGVGVGQRTERPDSRD